MSIARKILGNTFVQFGGKLITAALSVVVLKMISGYLGTAGYGDYTTVYEFLAFFAIAADFGIFTITVKEMSQKKDNMSEILGNALGLRTVLTILTMLLAVIVVFLIPKYQGTVIPFGVALATVATLFNLLNGTISTVLQVHLKMQYATISLVLGKIIGVAYMALAINYLFAEDPQTGFYHLLLAGILTNGVMLGITTYYTRLYAKITYRFDWPYWKRLFKTALPYGVALVLNTLYFRLDVVLMTLLLPDSQTLANGTSHCLESMCGDTEVGLYGVAMRFLEMLIIIPVYFMNAVLPTMTRYLEEKSEKLRQLVQYSFDFLVATGLPLLVGGFLLATPIIFLVSDPEFVGGYVYDFGSDTAIRLLMFAMFFSFLSTLFGFVLVALSRQTTLMWINLIGVLFNLIANLLVIPEWGFRGAATTSIISELIVVSLNFWFARKALGFHLEFGRSLKVFLASALMGLTVFSGLRWMEGIDFKWQLAALVPTGMFVYGMVILKTNVVTKEMRELLRKK